VRDATRVRELDAGGGGKGGDPRSGRHVSPDATRRADSPRCRYAVPMPGAFPCSLCGAADAIALPGHDGTVTCAACKKMQPARAYEMQRILLDFMRVKSRMAAAVPPSIGPDSSAEPAACPACGDDLFTADFACRKCGYGRRSFVARHRGAIPAIVAVGIGAVGAIGILTVGRLLPEGPWMNAMLLAMSMIFSGFGVHALSSPTTLSVAPSLGQDAWGMNQWGPSRPATYEQGMMLGSIFLVAGLAFLLLSIFLGYAVGP
jgi:hypothetical protein